MECPGGLSLSSTYEKEKNFRESLIIKLNTPLFLKTSMETSILFGKWLPSLDAKVEIKINQLFAIISTNSKVKQKSSNTNRERLLSW